MAVGRSLLIDGPSQIQHADNSRRTQIEILPDNLHQTAVRKLSCAEGIHIDRGWPRYADSVRELNLTFVRQSGRHNILRHIAGRVGCGAVHLRAVLSGESAAAMAGHAAVGVHDNLASCQSAVSVGTADHKTPRRIDIELRIPVHHIRRNHLVKHIFPNILVNLLLGYLLAVLGGKHHRVQPAGPAILIIFHRHLGLSVRAEVGKRAVFADLRELPHQLVGQGDGIGHQLRRLICGVAEHHTLVARADGFDLVLRHLMLLRLQRLVHAHSDIRGLLVDSRDHRAVFRVKAVFPAVIANLPDRVPYNLLDVYIAFGGDLTHDQHHARSGSRLAGHPAHGILLKQGVQNRVGNLVADLVRVSFGYGFGGK